MVNGNNTTGRKEIIDPIRINLILESDEIKRLNLLSEKSRISRNKLIRIACNMLLEIVKGKSISKSMNDKILDVLKSVYYREGWDYNEREVKEQINKIYLVNRDHVLQNGVNTVDRKLTFHALFLDDKTEVLSSVEFDEEDKAILREMIRLRRAKNKLKNKK